MTIKGKELRAFLELNEAMALRFIIELMHDTEMNWDHDDAKNQSLADLLEVLDWAAHHSGPKVRALAESGSRIPAHPEYHQFMSLVAPIERAHARAITDSDGSVRSLDRKSPSAERRPLSAILDNLRSAFNMGAIIRTAECMGVSHLYLSGYTATPDQEKLKKAAMGAEVPWSWHPRAGELITELRQRGQKVFAMETSSEAKDLSRFLFPPEPAVLVFGNERYGLEPSLIGLCDGTLEIPCRGLKNSLNVAVTFGMACFEWGRQHQLRTQPYR